jgi:fructokinase
MKSSPLHHDVVCYGEILWDFLPDKSLPGGAPMNVAYHLKKLGANPALITRIGKDGYGEKLVDLLSQSGITTDNVQVDNIQLTGLVYANPNEYNEVTYEIVRPMAWDFIEWEDAFIDLLKQAELFVYGSLTSRSDVSRNTLYQLLDIAPIKVLDINLRPPYVNRSDIEFLLHKANILKINLAELELINGWYGHLQHIEGRMKLLQDRFNIETIIVTMGGEGALLINNETICRHPGYPVQVADTIGCGDAFLAGFISQVAAGVPVQQALSFACAAGTFIASQTGACPQYEPSQIQTVMNNYSERPSLFTI